MFIIQNWVLILMSIAFICVSLYIVHSIYIIKELKKINDKTRNYLNEISEKIEKETDKQLNNSLLSPIDYSKGTRKPKKGE